MAIKLTLQDAQNHAIDNGGICLSKCYINNRTKMLWQCSKKHQWIAAFGNIRSGHWCPDCNLNKKTIDDMRQVAQQRGGKCLSVEYKNNRQKLEWECEYGHKWFVDYNTIQRGCWCPECRKVHIEDAIELAKNKNGFCLSNTMENSSSKLTWKCAHNHIWEAEYRCIQAGYWCPECAGVRKKTLEDAITLAKERNGKCLSTEYVNSSTKLKWMCENGHIWETTYNQIYNGCWCPECRKNSIEDAKLWATKMDGKCISEIYIGAKEKLKWKCSDNHEWVATYDNVVNNKTWCPVCKISSGERLLIRAIKSFYRGNVINNFREFSWLKNPETNCNLEIDIWIPELKLAIEYDGIQHFKPIKFSTNTTDEQALKALGDIKKLDRLKNKLMKRYKKEVKYFIRFNYREKDKLTIEYVRNKLMANQCSV